MTDMTCAQLLDAGRWDIYGNVHKGLRRGHSLMLQRLGSADFTQGDDGLLTDLRDHFALAAMHLAHEDDHIHTAIEAKSPAGAAALNAQHDDHRTHLAELETALAALEAGVGTPAAKGLGRALYLNFTHFVAEDFEHMAHEEEVVWPMLCALFTDEELMQIELSIVSQIAPPLTVAFMQLMIPAINPAERAAMLGGMKANAPPEAYAAVFEHAARPTLSANDLDALAALDLAA